MRLCFCLCVGVFEYETESIVGTLVVLGFGEEALIEEPQVAAPLVLLVDVPQLDARRVQRPTHVVVLLAVGHFGKQALIVSYKIQKKTNINTNINIASKRITQETDQIGTEKIISKLK